MSNEAPKPAGAHPRPPPRRRPSNALARKGDMVVQDGHLWVTLEPMTSPNRTQPVARLCDQLNATDTRCPGTNLNMRYTIQLPEM